MNASIVGILAHNVEGMGYRELYRSVNNEVKVTWYMFNKCLLSLADEGFVNVKKGLRGQRKTYALNQPSPVVMIYGRKVSVDGEIFRRVILEQFAKSPRKLLEQINAFFCYCWLRALLTGMTLYRRATKAKHSKNEEHAENLERLSGFEVIRFSMVYTEALLEIIRAKAHSEDFYKIVTESFEQENRKMEELIRDFNKIVAERVEQRERFGLNRPRPSPRKISEPLRPVEQSLTQPFNY